MILGCVLAGGRSRRFGSDKALVRIDGLTLLEHAVATLRTWCVHVVIAGRADGPAPCIEDWPAADLGPLGGIAAALRLASERGDTSVLTCGVDSIPLPPDLPALLSPAPAFLAGQPVVGHWISANALTAAELLESGGSRSIRAFAAATGARAVPGGAEVANINTPADLAALIAGPGASQ